MKNIFEKLELMLEFPWIQVSDDKVVDLEFEKLRGKEDIVNKITIELAKLTDSEKKQFIDILFSDYLAVMDRLNVSRGDLTVKSLISEGAFGTFEYAIPDDKKQLMLDFYLISTMHEDSDNLDIDLSIKETKEKLIPYLKNDMLNAVYFSVACEFRHCWDSAASSKKDVLAIFKSKGIGKQIEQYIRLMGGWKFAKLKVREPKDTPKIIRPRGEETYRDRFNSYRACKTVWKNDADFMKVAKVAFYDLKWGSSFGGENWGKIADGWLHLNSSTDTKDTSVWIDHVYALQHNTGTVFNKLKEYYDKNSGYDWLKKTLDYKFNLQEPMDFVDKVSTDLKRLYAAYNASFKVSGTRHDVGDTEVFGGKGEMAKREVPSLERWEEIKKKFEKGYGDKWSSNPDDLKWDATKSDYSVEKDLSNIKVGDIVQLQSSKFIPNWSIVRHIGKLGTVGESDSIWIDKILYDKKGNKVSFGSPQIEKIAPVSRSSILGIKIPSKEDVIPGTKTKLKVGDKVKLISNKHGNSKNNPVWGSTYGNISGIITSISTSSLPFKVKWENDKANVYKEDDLELITSSGKFKIGDKVKVVQGNYGITKIGSTGTIESITNNLASIDFDYVTGDKSKIGNYSLDIANIEKIDIVEPTSDTNLKVGDKVKYIGRSVEVKDWTGTIESFSTSGFGKLKATMKWDKKGGEHITPFLKNLVKIGKDTGPTQQYTELWDLKIGDIVEYTGSKLKKSLGGVKGKIVGKKTKLNFKIKWENGKRGSFYYKFLKKVGVETIADILAEPPEDISKPDTDIKVGDIVKYIGSQNASKKGKIGKVISDEGSGLDGKAFKVKFEDGSNDFTAYAKNLEKIADKKSSDFKDIKVGDIVKYIGTSSPEVKGLTGVVTSIDGGQVFVDWEGYKEFGVFMDNLEKITSTAPDKVKQYPAKQLKVGDKILKTFSGGAFDKDIKGTVIEVAEDMNGLGATAKIKWANDTETIIDQDGDYEILGDDKIVLKSKTPTPIGDIVLVKKAGGSHWVSEMHETIGKFYTVDDNDSSTDSVQLSNGYWYDKDVVMKFPFEDELKALDKEGKIKWTDVPKGITPKGFFIIQGDIITSSNGGIYVVVKVEEKPAAGTKEAYTRYWISSPTKDIKAMNQAGSDGGSLSYVKDSAIRKVGKLI